MNRVERSRMEVARTVGIRVIANRGNQMRQCVARVNKLRYASLYRGKRISLMAIRRMVARTSNRAQMCGRMLMCVACALLAIGARSNAISAANSIAQTNGQAKQASKKKSKTKPTPAPAIPPAPPPPFRAGEVLNYSGEWLKISGAITATLAVKGQQNFSATTPGIFRRTCKQTIR